MSKKLRVLALVLAALLAVTAFAGCKKKGPSKDDSSVMTNSGDVDVNGEDVDPDDPDPDADVDGDGEEDDTNSKTTSRTNSKATGNRGKIEVNKKGWPIVNKKYTIDVMAFALPGRGDPKKMKMFKYYEDKTNVAVNYIGVAENAGQERSRLALASGDIPDVFALYYDTFSEQDFVKYGCGKKPVFADVKDLLPIYAPNINKQMEYPLVKFTNTIDGRVLTLPKMVSKKLNYDHYLNINKQWLDNLGLSIPKTTNDLLKTLRAFRDDDPNMNGQADEIPCGVWNWSAGFITSMWGLQYGPDNVAVDQNLKVYYADVMPAAKAAAQFWHDIRKEKGMMDTKIVGDSSGFWSNWRKHIATGKVGYFQWSYLNGWDPKLLNQFEPIAVPTANFNHGKYKLAKAVNPSNNRVNNGSVVITTKCQSIPAVLRYFDYFYTNEGIMLGTWGPEGGLYKRLSNGEYSIPLASRKDGVREKDAIGWAMSIPQEDCMSVKVHYEGETAKEKNFNKYMEKANRVYQKAAKENLLYYVAKTGKTSQELAKLRKYRHFMEGSGRLSCYVTEWKADLAGWSTDVNKNFYAKGLDDFLKIMQGIVDRNKKYAVTTADPYGKLKK